MFSRPEDEDGTLPGTDGATSSGKGDGLGVSGGEDKVVNLTKVEPYGADEIREVLVKRKQEEQNRHKQERLRLQAYKESLDIKLFEVRIITLLFFTLHLTIHLYPTSITYHML